MSLFDYVYTALVVYGIVGDKWVALTSHLEIFPSFGGVPTATHRSFVLFPPPPSPLLDLRVEHSTLET